MPADLRPPLPKWRSYREVQAARIEAVLPPMPRFGTHQWELKLEGGATRFVPSEFERSWLPEAGWYFVVHEDGMQAAFPSAIFEKLYRPVEESPVAVTTGWDGLDDARPRAAAVEPSAPMNDHELAVVVGEQAGGQWTGFAVRAMKIEQPSVAESRAASASSPKE